MESKSNSLLLLEHLPNEIFREILFYLNGVDAFITFSPLNNRFRCLVLQYCKSFDFQSVCKTEFDSIFQQYNTQQWKSLRLVNDDFTSGQIEYFITQYSDIKSFNQLESLSLMSRTSVDEHMLVQLSSILQNLSSLEMKFTKCITMSKLNLTKLKQLVITNECQDIDWNKDLPHLESLEYHTESYYVRSLDSTWPVTLKRLKFICERFNDFALLSQSLRHLSQLRTLEIYQKKMENFPPNGRIWEELISSSFPLLKTFKFYFQFKSLSSSSGNHIQEIIASFSTPFYVIEKNWFIRCDTNKSKNDKLYGVVYSLPFDFDEFTIVTKYFNESITTILNDNNQNLYRNTYSNVKTLRFRNSPALDENFKPMNITRLIIDYYIHFNEWTHMISNVRSLSIASHVRMWSKTFGHLLNNTPNLCSLAVEKDLLQGMTKNWSDANICNSLSNKIRSLKLHFTRSKTGTNEIHQIVRIFAQNCEHLLIDLRIQPTAIAYILQNMNHLQNLYVRIESKQRMSSYLLGIELKQKQKVFTDSNSVITKYGRDQFHLRKYSQFESLYNP